MLPALLPSQTMSDLAIWPFLPTSTSTVVMTHPSLQFLRWADLGRSPSISRSNREHRHTRAVTVEQTVKLPRRRVAYPALRLAHRSTLSPCCGDACDPNVVTINIAVEERSRRRVIFPLRLLIIPRSLKMRRNDEPSATSLRNSVQFSVTLKSETCQ